MIRRITASILLCLSMSALAVDHLEPEDSIYSGRLTFEEYEDQLLRYFNVFYQDGVLLRLISTPSFSPEYALGIQKEKDSYFIFYQRPKEKLWAYQMELPFKLSNLDDLKKEGKITGSDYKNKLKELNQKYPENPLDMPKISCRKKIDQKLALDIHFIWIEMLLQTKYSRDTSSGVDGQTYHFSAPMQSIFLNYAGQVWSPEPKSKTGKLVEISDLMVDYCLKGDEAKIEKLLVKKIGRFKPVL